MRERELKLALPGRFALPDLEVDGGPVERVELPELQLRASYHDTDTLRLARHGVTLRHRRGEPDGPTWTVKLPVLPTTDDVVDREELHYPGSPREVPAEARALLAALIRTADLRPVATLRTRRRRWLLRLEGVDLAELTDDEVSVLEGRRVVARFRELELEERVDHAPLRELGDQLLAAGAAPAEPIPKVVRALGSRATAPPDVVVADRGSASTIRDLAAAAIGDAVLRILHSDPLARLGDPEGVHQLRVATRRLRSDLVTLRDHVDRRWADHVRRELAVVADRLGDVRDLDVQRARLEAHARDLRADLRPLWRDFERRHAEARLRLLAALEDPGYAVLLDDLVAAATQPPVGAAADGAAAELGPGLFQTAWRGLERRADALLGGEPNAVLHAVRIRAKRARYAAECVARGLPPRRASDARRLASHLAELQDLLGAVQDGAVAVENLHAAVAPRPRDARFAFAAGRLVEREVALAEAARGGIGDLWADLRRRRRRKWAET